MDLIKGFAVGMVVMAWITWWIWDDVTDIQTQTKELFERLAEDD